MENSIPHFVSILFAIGAAQGFFLAIVLFRRQSIKMKSDKVMALLVVTYSCHLAYLFLSYSGYLKQVPLLYGSSAGLMFLVSPLFYLYANYFFHPQRKFHKTDLLHFIPYLLLSIYLLPLHFLSAEQKLHSYLMDMASQGLHPFSWAAFLINTALIIQVFVYLFFSYRIYRQQTCQQKDQSKQYLIVLSFFGLFSIAFTLYLISAPVFEIGYFNVFCYGIKIFMGLSIYALAYVSFMKPQSQQEEEDEIKKYKNSPLSQTQTKALAEKIEHYLTVEKPYLSADFNLGKLSDHLNIPTHYVSQTINVNFRCTFPELINRYRIEEAKRLLTNEELKIIAVALDCGFNNKVTFNNAFKKETGLVPSDYRKQLVLQ